MGFWADFKKEKLNMIKTKKDTLDEWVKLLKHDDKR